MICYVVPLAMSMSLGRILTVVVMLYWMVGMNDLLSIKVLMVGGEWYLVASGEWGWKADCKLLSAVR
jgi:hypothetical protein